MKGQLTVEYYISLIIFSLFVLYLVFQLIGITPVFMNEINDENLRIEAYKLSELLINDPGEPIDWGDWLSGWSHRKPITIQDNSGTSLSDYQVSLTIDTKALISEGKMNSTCSDIRFTDSDGITEFSYWIESGCNSINTKIWVKVPFIPASSTKTIYMYYGNPSASSASDRGATFPLFDDFNDEALDPKWTWLNEPTTWDEGITRSGWLHIVTDKNGNHFLYQETSGNFEMETKLDAYPFAHLQQSGIEIEQDADNLFRFGYGRYVFFIIGAQGIAIVLVEDGTVSTPYWKVDSGSPKYFKLIRTRDRWSVWYYDDDTPKWTFMESWTQTLIDPIKIGIIMAAPNSGTNYPADFDYFKFRKYTSPEPSSSVGSEETLEVEIQIKRIGLSSNENKTNLLSQEKINALQTKCSSDYEEIRKSLDTEYYFSLILINRTSNEIPWLSGYNYRKQITINGTTAGARTNYQMKLTIYKGTGTDSGSSVYLNNHCQDDFDDIRFTKSDGTTLLDYWIESYTSGTSAIVWIEFDSIPALPSTANFYLYYDNPSAFSASNGVNTFLFFDDFDDNSFDTSKWAKNLENPGSVIDEIGGRLRVTKRAYPYTKNNFPGPIIIEFTAETAGTNSYPYFGITRFDGDANEWSQYRPYNGIAYWQAGAQSIKKERAVNGAYTVTGPVAITITANTKYPVKIMDGKATYNTKYYFNGILLFNESETTTYTQNKVSPIAGHQTTVFYVYADDFRIRKYVSPEPTFGTWGSEETPPEVRIQIKTLIDCKPTIAPTRETNVTISRIVALDDKSFGELILYVW